MASERVELCLPEDVIAELELGESGTRGAPELMIAVEGLNLFASFITVAGLAGQLPTLARALRRWVGRQPATGQPIRLLVKGPGTNMELDLPPNVDTARIVAALSRLLSEE
ncbi:ABC transporter substrate-binding protein [Frankia sp. AgB32]|uniref:ABC transporter substrate-binding protein n=1 Tax=Frankia sp. AgB32 TaxID=631119 RepID=UPI00200F28AE|nr:ABC transporter substrate-binding protein [Frankia sp. AgB32]MCK9893624.1 ABC transporter substrate-binding protein [Frankia sp. AgB32]